MKDEFGNPSSNSNLGRIARQAVESSREELSRLLDCKLDEIVFLSGGTESCFSALAGFFRQNPGRKGVVHCATEHPAVLEAATVCADLGLCEVIEVRTSNRGAIDLIELEERIAKNPGALVSCMLANNETGIVSPIAEVVALAKRYKCYVHTDAVQAVGKIPVSFAKLGVDFLSLSGHKFGAPKGVGALLIREGSPWSPLVKGGGQENNRRGGTEAVAQIVGLGEAAKIRRGLLSDGLTQKLQKLRDKLEQRLISSRISEKIIGSEVDRLPNTTSAVISGVNSQQLIERLTERGAYVSAGSACSAGNAKPSKVLCAIGLPMTDCLSTIRISTGAQTEEKEVDSFLEILSQEGQAERERLLS